MIHIHAPHLKKRLSPTPSSPRRRSVRGQSPQVRHILKSPVLQPKLKIGAPDDKYEQGADRVAEQVMRMPEPRLAPSFGDLSPANSTIPHSESIQRVCASYSGGHTTDESENRSIKADSGEMENHTVESQIQSLRGAGRALANSERAFFEPRLARNLGQVRVHTGATAARAAQAINAQAFTVGRDIMFGARQYAPATVSGKRLLAHELVHTVMHCRFSGTSASAKPIGC